MTEARPRCRLIIAVEASTDGCEQLAAALGTGDIASVLVLPAAGKPLRADSSKPLVDLAQKAGSAALILGNARLACDLRADGVHVSSESGLADYKQARDLLGSRSIVGGDAGRSRDAAMRLGEAGADYVGFGIPDFVASRDAARQRRLELVGWWAEIFEVPCVALDVDTEDDAQQLARAGADFVAARLPASSPLSVTREAARALLAALAVQAA